MTTITMKKKTRRGREEQVGVDRLLVTVLNNFEFLQMVFITTLSFVLLMHNYFNMGFGSYMNLIKLPPQNTTD